MTNLLQTSNLKDSWCNLTFFVSLTSASGALVSKTQANNYDFHIFPEVIMCETLFEVKYKDLICMSIV